MELFKKYLGFQIKFNKEGKVMLPNLWEIENFLMKIYGTIKEVNNIKKIGEYLINLDIPEESVKWQKGLDILRKEALQNIV